MGSTLKTCITMNFRWFNYVEFAVTMIALLAWVMMITNKDRAKYQPQGGPTLTFVFALMVGIAGFTQGWILQTLLVTGAFLTLLWGITASTDNVAWCDRNARYILAVLGLLICGMAIRLAFPPYVTLGQDVRSLVALLILVGAGFSAPLGWSLLSGKRNDSAITPIPASPMVPTVAEPPDIPGVRKP